MERALRIEAVASASLLRSCTLMMLSPDAPSRSYSKLARAILCCLHCALSASGDVQRRQPFGRRWAVRTGWQRNSGCCVGQRTIIILSSEGLGPHTVDEDHPRWR